jgi:hypothetical protein
MYESCLAGSGQAPLATDSEAAVRGAVAMRKGDAR